MISNIAKIFFSLILVSSVQISAIDPRIKAGASLAFAGVAMTATKKLEKNEMVRKIAAATGLDPFDVTGVIGVSAGCFAWSALSNDNIAPGFIKYAIRAPLAGLVGYLATTQTCNDVVVNIPLIGDFLARKEKHYTLYDKDGKELNMDRCKLVNQHGELERIVGDQYASNYRCRGAIIVTAAYMAVNVGINKLVEKHPNLSFLNGVSASKKP